MLVDPDLYAPYPYRRNRLTVSYMDALDLRFEDETFDFVVSFGSIEHFGGIGAAGRSLAEAARVLKPGGVAAVTTEFAIDGGPHASLPDLELFTAETIPQPARARALADTDRRHGPRDPRQRRRPDHRPGAELGRIQAGDQTHPHVRLQRRRRRDPAGLHIDLARAPEGGRHVRAKRVAGWPVQKVLDGRFAWLARHTEALLGSRPGTAAGARSARRDRDHRAPARRTPGDDPGARRRARGKARVRPRRASTPRSWSSPRTRGSSESRSRRSIPHTRSPRSSAARRRPVVERRRVPQLGERPQRLSGPDGPVVQPPRARGLRVLGAEDAGGQRAHRRERVRPARPGRASGRRPRARRRRLRVDDVPRAGLARVPGDRRRPARIPDRAPEPDRARDALRRIDRRRPGLRRGGRPVRGGALRARPLRGRRARSRFRGRRDAP